MKKKGLIVVVVMAILVLVMIKGISLYQEYDLKMKKDRIVKSTVKYLEMNPEIDKQMKLGHCYISTKMLYDGDYISYDESHTDNGKIINLYLHYDLNDNTITYLEENIDGLKECSK